MTWRAFCVANYQSHFESSLLVGQQRPPGKLPVTTANVSCDAVVIGGGITGALVAVHLAEVGVKTIAP